MENRYLIPGEIQERGLRDYLTVIFKHKIKIITVFLTVVMTVTLVTFLMPRTYEARSNILVKIGREYMNPSEVGDKLVMPNQEEMTNSEIQILTNRDLVKKVIMSLKIENIYPEIQKDSSNKIKPLDAAISKFGKSLKVTGIRKSNVIQVSFQHSDPRIAAQAVNQLVEFYKEKHLQVFSDPKSSFLENQFMAYKQKLEESESSLQAFKQKNKVFSLDDQRRLLLDQRTNLDTSLKIAENSISELQKKTSSLKGQMKRISDNKISYTQTERDKIIVDARARLLSLQLEEQELLKKYTENNRLVINIRKEIQMVSNFMKEQEEEINSKVKSANPVFQNVEIELIRAEADMNSQKAKAASLSKQLLQVDGEIQSLDFREKGLQQLQREQTINEKNYHTYADMAEEARITDDMNRLKFANISVIEEASVPVKPVSPRKKLNILLGLIFGAISGVGLAFLLEQTAQNFSTPESVEKRLGLQVLAAIPYREG